MVSVEMDMVWMKMVDVYQNTRAVQIVIMDTKMMKAGECISNNIPRGQGYVMTVMTNNGDNCEQK